MTARGRHPRQTPLATGFGFGPPRGRAQPPLGLPGALVLDAAEPLTIGEVAVRHGVTIRTLRFYEQKGLLTPLRSGRQRMYGAAHIGRLAQILEAKRLGFALREIAMMLTVRPGDQPTLTREQVAAQIAHLERQKAEIDAALADLRARLPPA